MQHDANARLIETRPAAAALLEDLLYLEQLASEDAIDVAGLRRASAVMRRLVVEAELVRIASPRIGRIMLLQPDNNPVYAADRSKQIPLFLSGAVRVFGLELRGAMIEWAGRMQPLPDFSEDRRIEVTVESFRRQDVILFEGHKIKRGAIIKYVANKASGVHSGRAEDAEERLIERIRHAASLSVVGGTANLSLNLGAFSEVVLPFVYRPDALDPVLLELLASIQLLASAPDVGRLKRVIQIELGVLP